MAPPILIALPVRSFQDQAALHQRRHLRRATARPFRLHERCEQHVITCVRTAVTLTLAHDAATSALPLSTHSHKPPG